MMPKFCYELFRDKVIKKVNTVLLFRKDLLFRVILFRFGPFQNTKDAILRNTEFREMTTLFCAIANFVSSLFCETRL